MNTLSGFGYILVESICFQTPWTEKFDKYATGRVNRSALQSKLWVINANIEPLCAGIQKYRMPFLIDTECSGVGVDVECVHAFWAYRYRIIAV